MLPHKAPYNLRQIMTVAPEVSATPGAHAEKLVYDVAKENAAEQAAGNAGAGATGMGDVGGPDADAGVVGF